MSLQDAGLPLPVNSSDQHSITFQTRRAIPLMQLYGVQSLRNYDVTGFVTVSCQNKESHFIIYRPNDTGDKLKRRCLTDSCFRLELRIGESICRVGPTLAYRLCLRLRDWGGNRLRLRLGFGPRAPQILKAALAIFVNAHGKQAAIQRYKIDFHNQMYANYVTGTCSDCK